MFKKGDLVVRIEDDPGFPNLKRGMMAIVWDLYPYSNKFKCRYLGRSSYHREHFSEFKLATKLERALYEQRINTDISN